MRISRTNKDYGFLTEGLRPLSFKELHIEELKKARDAAVSAPVDGVDVRNESDLNNITYAITLFDMLASDGKIKWTLADNTDRLVTKENLQDVFNKYVARKLACFKKYQELKEQVMAAETDEAASKIVWSD